MDAYGKARELGSAIAVSAQMKRLKDCESALESDKNARTIMNDYTKLQIEVLKAAKDKDSRENLEALRAELENMQKEINENLIVKDFMDAKSEFDSFMKTINDVIIFSISGEESCSSGKCGSCGGCGGH